MSLSVNNWHKGNGKAYFIFVCFSINGAVKNLNEKGNYAAANILKTKYDGTNI